MKSISEIVNAPFVKSPTVGEDGAMFLFTVEHRPYNVIVSNGGGWDHVSVTPANSKRIPSWNVMCALKELCFTDDEVVMELHPAEKDYVNFLETCLHLWRPQNISVPTPPRIFV